jgi:hypothetical protein
MRSRSAWTISIVGVVRGVVVDDATDVDTTVAPRFFLGGPVPNPASIC